MTIDLSQVYETLDETTRAALDVAGLETSHTVRLLARTSLARYGVDVNTDLYGTAGDAELALRYRHLVGVSDGWTEYSYAELTRPWRTVVGQLHPDDADLMLDVETTDPEVSARSARAALDALPVAVG